MATGLAQSARAADAPLMLSQCVLSGRVPEADGVFRLPETVRLNPRALDVTCLAVGSSSANAVAKLSVTQEGVSEAQSLGSTTLSFAPPAAGVTIMAEHYLPAGEYKFRIDLVDEAGNEQGKSITLPVAIAVGEGYAVPELAEAHVAEEAAMQTSEPSAPPLTNEKEASMPWMTLTVLTICLILLLSWFFLRRRAQGSSTQSRTE